MASGATPEAMWQKFLAMQQAEQLQHMQHKQLQQQQQIHQLCSNIVGDISNNINRY